MGVMRRVEHRLERTVEGLFGHGRKRRVQPPELAAKLTKEMEASKRPSVSHTYVANLYTVYLCPEDRDALGAIEEHLREELAAHLEEHARTAGYAVVGPVQVHVQTDPDLRLGRFGIRTEMSEAAAPPVTLRPPAEQPFEPAVEPSVDPQPLPASVPAVPVVLPAVPPVSNGAEDAPMSRVALPEAKGAAGNPLAGPIPTDTQSIPAHVARDLGLARQVIILRRTAVAGSSTRPASSWVARRECDFPLDDPNISRRHAVIYWETGTPFVKDLDSTNGTLLNGRPVTSASWPTATCSPWGAHQSRRRAGVS